MLVHRRLHYEEHSEMYLERWVQFCASQYKRDGDILVKIHQRAMRLIKGLEHLLPQEAERVRAVHLKRRWPQIALIHMFKYGPG